VARILLADDDELVRATVASMLRDLDHEVFEATNGNEALEVLERVQVDAAVLDILMPQKEGIETLRDLRKRWPKLPVLMISGGDRTGWNDALGMATVLGANRTLRKPFTPRQLAEHIAAMLAEAASGAARPKE